MKNNKAIATISKIFKHKIVLQLIATLLVILITIGAYYILSNKKYSADTEHLNALLQRQSDLTTAKLTITGLTEFRDTGVRILNRADFILVYQAEIRAGIDVKNVEITTDDTNKTISVIIPKATVQTAKILPESIKYFDEHFALFNINEKEDANAAQKLAEDAAIKEAMETGILELADNQAEALIKGILSEATPEGYQITVKQK